MNLLLWGLTIGTIGKLILGIAVLRVHVGILKEHRIDGVVLKAIKREQLVTLFGLILIVVGFLLEVLFYSGSTHLLECTGSECASAVEAALSQ